MHTIIRRGWWLLLAATVLAGRSGAAEVRYEIQFPNLPGYVTLKCDFHMHTVFSDGLVWPTVRVAEAWRQGLDAIAITDHIEYQPHQKDVPTQHGRAYELALSSAATHDLLLIRAAEITRPTPPGHFNALFLTDVGALDTPDFVEAIRRANAQGAFVCWNHQGWQGPDKGRWLDLHTTLYEHKWFQGMEISNYVDDEYYPAAHQWCLEKNLTLLGTTDIHDTDLRSKSNSGDHRNMTLVFAQARTLEAVKEALFAGRTVVWFKDQLIGRKEYLEPLFKRCVEVVPPRVWPQKIGWVQVRNLGEADIQLERPGNWRPERLLLPARSTTLVKAVFGPKSQLLQLKYTATNFLIAPGKALDVVLTVPKPSAE
jgi:hypothetical protein